MTLSEQVRHRAMALALGVSAFGFVDAANAAVIPGPTLGAAGFAWSVTGLEFHANQNSALTGFVYQNQGQADSVVLTDSLGNILFSLATPAANSSYVASVNWALTGGNDYFLLQTATSNELFASFGSALPSNADISIIQSGTFGDTMAEAVTNAWGWGPNEYWAAFNDITTGTATSIPEPASLALLGMGLLGAAGLRRRKIKS